MSDDPKVTDLAAWKQKQADLLSALPDELIAPFSTEDIQAAIDELAETAAKIKEVDEDAEFLAEVAGAVREEFAALTQEQICERVAVALIRWVGTENSRMRILEVAGDRIDALESAVEDATEVIANLTRAV